MEARELFVLEGDKFVADAAVSGFEFEAVLHDSGIRAGRLSALARHRPTAVSREVLARFCEAKSPQHVVALARRRESSAEDILTLDGPAVFLHAVQEPGNVGAIARIVEAVAGAGILASQGTADFFHPRALRASAGSLLRVPVASAADVEAAFRQARSAGREIRGAVRDGGESAFDRRDANALWVLGSEGPGLPDSVVAALDRRITIPMNPPVESLNVAVAAGILLYLDLMNRPASAVAPRPI